MFKLCFFHSRVDDTSFAFVSAHLAAHMKYCDVRNQNFRQILKAASLGNAQLDFDSQFHHVIWLGDLNYRVNLNKGQRARLSNEGHRRLFRMADCYFGDVPGFETPKKGAEHSQHWGRVHQLIKDGRWSKLMEHDQLCHEKSGGRCFVNFVEAQYNFAPTFKVRSGVLCLDIE